MPGAGDSIELRAALVVADRAYVPIQASQFDVWTLDQMDGLVSQAQSMNPDLKAYVVINRASPNPMVEESKDARELLDEFENLELMKVVIRDRIVYRKAARYGMAISEMPKRDTKACAEIDLLYQEIYG
jgi:chromosome partitioning protein